jgi:pyrimidine operon attenuation protein/uracil phosphoribosyltransferase
MKILNHTQIQQKIKRLAYEITENNIEDGHVILAGVNRNGKRFAEMLRVQLDHIGKIRVEMASIILDPANPLKKEISFEWGGGETPQGENIIIVDDVANTGRTLFFAFKPLMAFLPSRIQCAVLVDRKHKSFPIHVDFVGLSLATTLKENIEVDLGKKNAHAVYLK